jgi:hypothetical protein
VNWWERSTGFVAAGVTVTVYATHDFVAVIGGGVA